MYKPVKTLTTRYARDTEGEALMIPPLSPGIAPGNRCGIFNSGTPELQIPQHFFSVSLCFQRSGW
jgi:hypothetical protein